MNLYHLAKKRIFYDKTILPLMSELAHSKYPKDGKCKDSCFANGTHRVGNIPVESLLDGGAAGDICYEVCLECGKLFNNSSFVLKNQPRTIGET